MGTVSIQWYCNGSIKKGQHNPVDLFLTTLDLDSGTLTTSGCELVPRLADATRNSLHSECAQCGASVWLGEEKALSWLTQLNEARKRGTYLNDMLRMPISEIGASRRLAGAARD